MVKVTYGGEARVADRIIGRGSITISGAAAELSMKVGTFIERGTATQIAAEIEQALGDPTIQTALQDLLERQVRKSFGKRYAAEPLAIDPRAGSIVAVVTAVYIGPSAQTGLTKSAGETLETLRRDMRLAIQQRIASAQISVMGSWQFGSGVATDEFLVSANTPEPKLQSRLLSVRGKRDAAVRAQYAALAAAIVVPVFAVLFGLLAEDLQVGGYMAAYALVAIPLFIFGGRRVHEAEEEIRDITNELDLRAIESGQLEARAQKLFQVHSHDLKRYYDQALRQGRNIFYVGLLCIVLGFGIIIAAFLMVSFGQPDFDEKIVIASLSAVGGILANFIGVIYLKMYSETVRSVTGFHQRLVVTHHLHFGNFLVAKIGDDAARNTTLAEMAIALAATPSGDPIGSADGASAT